MLSESTSLPVDERETEAKPLHAGGDPIVNFFVRLRLLPHNQVFFSNWVIYSILAVFPLYYVPYLTEPDALSLLPVAMMGELVFSICFFRSTWVDERGKVAYSLALVAAGLIMMPINAAAFVFFAYALLNPMLSFNIKQLMLYSTIIIGVAAAQSIALGYPAIWVSALSMSAILGSLTKHFFFQEFIRNKERLKMQETIESLARSAERERIARDLHDILGHTLSMITIKAELAGRLVRKDQEASVAEIKDIENAARSALQQVRMAISGYRSDGIQHEFNSTKAAFAAAGIRFSYRSDSIKLSEAQQNVIGFVLKEATTNVLRHAQATECHVELNRHEDFVLLTLKDNGIGYKGPKGNGLQGMSERLTIMGGQLKIKGGTEGTQLQVLLPLREV